MTSTAQSPFHVSGIAAEFFDDLDFAGQASVRCVDFDEVGLADARFFDELEPVCCGLSDSPFRGINDGMIWSTPRFDS